MEELVKEIRAERLQRRATSEPSGGDGTLLALDGAMSSIRETLVQVGERQRQLAASQQALDTELQQVTRQIAPGAGTAQAADLSVIRSRLADLAADFAAQRERQAEAEQLMAGALTGFADQLQRFMVRLSSIDQPGVTKPPSDSGRPRLAIPQLADVATDSGRPSGAPAAAQDNAGGEGLFELWPVWCAALCAILAGLWLVLSGSSRRTNRHADLTTTGHRDARDTGAVGFATREPKSVDRVTGAMDSWSTTNIDAEPFGGEVVSDTALSPTEVAADLANLDLSSSTADAAIVPSGSPDPVDTLQAGASRVLDHSEQTDQDSAADWGPSDTIGAELSGDGWGSGDSASEDEGDDAESLSPAEEVIMEGVADVAPADDTTEASVASGKGMNRDPEPDAKESLETPAPPTNHDRGPGESLGGNVSLAEEGEHGHAPMPAAARADLRRSALTCSLSGADAVMARSRVLELLTDDARVLREPAPRAERAGDLLKIAFALIPGLPPGERALLEQRVHAAVRER